MQLNMCYFKKRPAEESDLARHHVAEPWLELHTVMIKNASLGSSGAITGTRQPTSSLGARQARRAMKTNLYYVMFRLIRRKWQTWQRV